MTHSDLATLGDVYEELNNDMSIKTTYVLQFLWRSMSSDFDLIGPYYTSSDGLDSLFTLACLYETMQSLESVGFKVKALICDGANWNLSMIKKLCEQSDSDQKSKLCEQSNSDQETMKQPDESTHSTSPWNPFSDEKCFIVNCPSHQVC